METRLTKENTSDQPYIIQPTQMSTDDSILLAYFLKKYNQLNFIANKPYPFPPLTDEKDITYFRLHFNGQLPQAVVLADLLAGRKCNNRFEEYHYDVYAGEMLGKGSQGCILSIKGNLKFSKDGKTIVYFANPSLVGKMQKTEAKKAENEFELSKRILDIKSLTFFPSGISIMTMKRIMGINLNLLIIDDQNKKLKSINDIDTNLRILICLRLLLFLLKIHKNNVIHRDIKPDNVMISIAKHGVEIRIIDLGYGRDALTDDGRYVGTIHFLSPEVFDKKKPRKNLISTAWEGLFRLYSGPTLIKQEIGKKQKV